MRDRSREANLHPVLPERERRILRLALPIIGGMVSQNLLNLVDTAFVSRLGTESLAGVGLASLANFMSVAFVTGLAAGVQATSARRKGEGALSETAVPLNGGLLYAVGFGVPIGAAVALSAPYFLPHLGPNDPATAQEGVDYLTVRLLSVPAVGMNFAFRGYWNAVDRSAVYLRTLVVMHIVNATLDYVLIFGKLGAPALGVEGAAWASVIATYTGTAYYFLQAFLGARTAGFLRGIPSRSDMWSMFRTSVPAAIQQLLFAAGMTVFFSAIAQLGRDELAASTALLNLLLVAILPPIGFGLAAASLVGQALGRQDRAEARRWGWYVIRTATPLIVVAMIVGASIPQLLLILFDLEPGPAHLAEAPLRVIALFLPADMVGLILLNALLGAGDSRRVLFVSAGMQWLVFLPLVWIFVLFFEPSLTWVWAINAFYRSIQAILFIIIWQRDGWGHAKI